MERQPEIFRTTIVPMGSGLDSLISDSNLGTSLPVTGQGEVLMVYSPALLSRCFYVTKAHSLERIIPTSTWNLSGVFLVRGAL